MFANGLPTLKWTVLAIFIGDVYIYLLRKEPLPVKTHGSVDAQLKNVEKIVRFRVLAEYLRMQREL